MILSSNGNYIIIIIGFQRFPVQRYRKPVNRRIGNTINPGLNGARFNSKPINKNTKPKPNLAKFPGIVIQKDISKFRDEKTNQ